MSIAPNRAPGFARGNPGNAPGNAHGHAYDRSGLANGTRHRMPYRRGRRHDRDDYFGVAIWPWWLNSYAYLGYPDFYQYPPWWDYDDSYDSQSAISQGPTQDYGTQPPPEEQPDSASLPPWPSINSPEGFAPTEQQSAPVQVLASPQPTQPVTLVFNNGRPSEKIQNFVLTADTLYVMDQQRRDIPVAELDLAETARVNRQAGVEFHIPGTPK